MQKLIKTFLAVNYLKILKGIMIFHYKFYFRSSLHSLINAVLGELKILLIILIIL